VEQLTREFGDLRAVDTVDLAVPSGGIFGFLGPNGAGKTTLVKILTTILSPTSGRATVAGYDVSSQGHEVRSAIGVALQEVGLDSLMTARELLVLQGRLFGADPGAARQTAERLLKTVGLDDVEPKKRTGQYSGGMKRRLDLALALVHDPAILFLDEPTTGLDPASRAGIWEEVRRLNRQGVTIFLTTQYLEEADRLADKVAIINHGRIVAQGPPLKLKQDLGGEVVTLTFDSAETAARANAELASIAADRQLCGAELSCYFPNASSAVAEIVRQLDAASISVVGLTLSRPTLDDVFLRATGERLPQSSGPEGAPAR
jgi:ABC-2 type transport system ATP-binding protein